VYCSAVVEAYDLRKESTKLGKSLNEIKVAANSWSTNDYLNAKH